MVKRECASCAELRAKIADLEKRLHAAHSKIWRDRKELNLVDKPRMSREIKRTDGVEHVCGISPTKAIRRILQKTPCRPMTEAGAGYLILMSCEYLRLMHCIEKTDRCWFWKGGLNPGGYGTFGWDNDRWSAHRFVYTFFRGAIKAGMVIDHTCPNKRCVNPEHLEVVTQGENVRRWHKPGWAVALPESGM